MREIAVPARSPHHSYHSWRKSSGSAYVVPVDPSFPDALKQDLGPDAVRRKKPQWVKEP